MALIPLLINILVLALVLWLIWYCLALVPLPDPPKKIIMAIITIIAVLYLLNLVVPTLGTLRIGLFAHGGRPTGA